MKAIRLLLLTIVDAALLSGGLYAVPTNPAADQAASESAPKAVSAQSNRPSGTSGPQSDARASGEQQGPRRSAKNRPRSKALATKPTRPRPIAGQRALPEAGNPANVRSSVPSQPAVVNHGSIQNEAIYRALPVRPSGMIRPAAPSAGNVRHRDPNPPVIGGAASSNSRSAAVIDGTRTKLKGPRN
jgi:hypothetical protein